MIATVNGLVAFSTLYYQWSLLEVTLAYLGEFWILALVNSARYLAARRLPASSRNPSAWKLWSTKAVNVGMSIAMCVALTVIPLGIIFITGTLGEDGQELAALWRPLGLCWAGFAATHVVAFVGLARQGAYRVLIDDSRVNVLLCRYPVLVAAAIGCAGEVEGYPVAPWFFVTALGAMAVVDTVTCMVDLEADTRALRRRPSPA